MPSLLFSLLFSLLLNNLNLLWWLLLIAFVVAAALAPLETMGWWAGWWLDDKERQVAPVVPRSRSTRQRYIIFFTGIAGSSHELNVPLERGFVDRLRERLPEALIIDSIYPYSTANRALTSDRLLARFWRFVLAQKLHGSQRIGFLINLRNILQILVAADDRYGAFFGQGAATVVLRTLHENGYRAADARPVTLIGYSGGGEVAAAAAPYLAQVLSSPVDVISLGGVFSSSPLIGRIDRLVHLYGTRDRIQRLGALFFPGRWPFVFASGWNQGKRSGRIQARALPGVGHDGRGGYLDPAPRADESSFLEQTLDHVVELLHTPVDPIPDTDPARPLRPLWDG